METKKKKEKKMDGLESHKSPDDDSDSFLWKIAED